LISKEGSLPLEPARFFGPGPQLIPGGVPDLLPGKLDRLYSGNDRKLRGADALRPTRLTRCRRAYRQPDPAGLMGGEAMARQHIPRISDAGRASAASKIAALEVEKLSDEANTTAAPLRSCTW